MRARRARLNNVVAQSCGCNDLNLDAFRRLDGPCQRPCKARKEPLERAANRCGVRVRGLRRRFDCAMSAMSLGLFSARAGTLIRRRRKPEPASPKASQVKAAGRRRPTAATAAEKMEDERADGQPDRRRRQERGGGRPIRSKGSGHQEQAAAEPPTPRRGYGGQGVRRVQRGRPPTAAQPEAEAQHAASVRAQAPRPSGAPCQARRSAGRGVWERRAWRAGWLPQQPA